MMQTGLYTDCVIEEPADKRPYSINTCDTDESSCFSGIDMNSEDETANIDLHIIDLFQIDSPSNLYYRLSVFNPTIVSLPIKYPPWTKGTFV